MNEQYKPIIDFSAEEDSMATIMKIESACHEDFIALFNASDDRFKSAFENAYKINRNYLCRVIMKNLDKISDKQFAFIKEYYNKDGFKFDWKMPDKAKIPRK